MTNPLADRNLQVRLVMINEQINLCKKHPTLTMVNNHDVHYGEGFYEKMPIREYWEREKVRCEAKYIEVREIILAEAA